MKRSILWSAALVVAAAACGGDDGDGGAGDAGVLENPGFAIPDVVTTAHTQNGAVWEEVGPANWECLNTPTDDAPSTVEITVSGTVRDFQYEDEVVPTAEISVFEGTDISGTPITTTTSGTDGTFSVTLPVGVERVAFKTAHEDYLDTYLMNQYYDPDTADQEEDQLEPVSLSLANALAAFINKERTLGTGILAGAIRDCDGNEVSGAIVAVSAVSGQTDHVEGAETYYFSGGANSLPVRLTVKPYTNEDGLFMAIELPPSSSEVYLQVWGFTPDQDPASDELTLLAEIGSTVIGDTVIAASLEALRQ